MRVRRSPPPSALLLAFSLSALGCGSPDGSPSAPASTADDGPTVVSAPHPEAPVIVISIDTLRSDRLPVYGHQGVDTPAIDALAADSTVFERAYSHYPLTLPSHAALLTGRLPGAIGVRDNAGYRLAAPDPTHLPHLLRAAGYATGAAVSSYAIRAATGLDQGFDFYDDQVDEERAGAPWGPERAGTRTLEAVLPWLEEVSGRPFFLFLHLYEPHLPYTPPEAFRERYGATYEAEIAAADAVVGALLDELRRSGLYEEAMIVLLSDHGEGLMDHGEEGHGVLLYREVLQVPLMIKFPAGQSGGRVAEPRVAVPVQLTDVLPTILEVLGLEAPPGLAGHSLVRPPADAERGLYAETFYPRLHYGWSELTSIVAGRHHFIDGPDPELYDLLDDPAERRNLLRERGGVALELHERLAALKTPLTPPVEEDEATRQELAALGYLSSSRPASRGAADDPKAALARSRELLDEALSLVYSERHGDAAPLLERLVELNPGMTDAWRYLGAARRQLGDHEAALEAFGRALALSHGSPQVIFQIGQVLAAAGRLDEARRHLALVEEHEPVLAAELGIEIALRSGAPGALDEALPLAAVSAGLDRVSPAARRRLGLALSDIGRHAAALELLGRLAAEKPEVPAWNAVARAHLAAGQTEAALPWVEKVLRAETGNPTGLELRGLIELRQGRAFAAREALERAVERDSGRANAWNLLGVARFQLGFTQGALEAWQNAVELDPKQWDSLFNLATQAAAAGRAELARRHLERYVATAPPERFGREIAEARQLLARLGGPVLENP